MLFVVAVRSYIHCRPPPLKEETDVSGNGSMEMNADVDVVDGQEVAQEHLSPCPPHPARLRVS